MQISSSITQTSTTAQVMIGWWWVLCIIITTAYRSSLISHLTVPGLSRPVNSFDDLLALEDWTWSAESDLTNMADRDFFLGSPSPVVRKVYRRMEVSVCISLFIYIRQQYQCHAVFSPNDYAYLLNSYVLSEHIIVKKYKILQYIKSLPFSKICLTRFGEMYPSDDFENSFTSFYLLCIMFRYWPPRKETTVSYFDVFYQEISLHCPAIMKYF